MGSVLRENCICKSITNTTMKNLLKFITTIILNLTCVSIYAQNCTVNAGVDKVICTGSTDSLLGNASGLFQTKPKWTIVGNSGASIQNVDSLTTFVSGLVRGNIYQFKISATCKDGSSVYNNVKINYAQLPSSPFAGNDTDICLIQGAKVKLNAKSVGSGEVGIWSIAQTYTGTFSDSNSASAFFNTKISGCYNLKYTLRWTVSNGFCNLFDDMNINYISGAAVSAGKHQVIKCSTKIKLNGSCPGEDSAAGTWTLISGPSGSSFDNAHKYNASLLNIQIGTYLLKWTVNSNCVSGSDTVSYDVVSITPPTPANSGANVNYCYSSVPAHIFLAGNAPASGEVSYWVQTVGPLVTIVNDSNPNTEIIGITKKGVYKFKYGISNGVCVSESNKIITIEGDSLIDAGPDFTLACNVKENMMKPKTSGGTWSILSGPSAAKVNGNRVYDLNTQGVYTFLYSYTGKCGMYYDTALVVTSFTPSKSNAGTDQSFACNITTGSLAANKPKVGFGKWDQISGPSYVVFGDINDPSSVVSNLIEGAYILRWTIEAGPTSIESTDEISIFVSSSTPTKSDAGADQIVGYNTPVYLNGNNPLKQEAGFWKLISGSGITFSDSTNPKAVMNGTKANNKYTLVWKIYNSCGNSFDTVYIKTTNKQGPSAAIACNDICLASGTQTTRLTSTAPTFGIAQWFQLSGPTKAYFEDSTSNNTGITNLVNGQYIFVWSVADSAQQVNKDSVLVTISDPASKANANEDQVICDVTALLSGNVPTVGKGIWSLVIGVGEINIQNPNNAVSLVNGLDSGKFTFRYTITNGACASNFDEMDILVMKKPTIANAGKDISGYNLDSVLLQANVAKSGKGAWSIVSAELGKPSLENIYNHCTVIKGLKPGVTKLVWTIAGNGICPSSEDTITITNLLYPYKLIKQTTCENTSVILSVDDSSALSGEWEQISGTKLNITTVGGGYPQVKSNAKAIQIMANKAGTYIFKYTYYAIGSVKPYALDTLVINPLPIAFAGVDYKINKDSGEILNLKGSVNAQIKYEWIQVSGPKAVIRNPKSSFTRVEYTDPGKYIFRYFATNGTCDKSDDIEITVVGEPKNEIPADTTQKVTVKVFVPNAFSPDGNGLNDNFGPVSQENIDYVMEVYNRWGEKVFSGNQQTDGWNGTFRNDACPSEVYIWVISYTTKDDKGYVQGETLSGQVALVR